MAQRHRTENASLVDATPSHPNTPLCNSNTWQQYLHYRPFPSGQAVSPPTAPGPSSAAFTAREVQRSKVSCAASADTTQWQSVPACLPASSSPAENDFSCAAAPPSDKSSASTLRRRCPSLVELLLASTCLSCDAASREALQQHVRGKRVKPIIEHLTETVRVSVGSQAALAFPGSQQLPLIAAVAAICSPEQQCRLLCGAYNDGCLPEFPAVSDDVYKSSTTSLPSSGPSACHAPRVSPDAIRSNSAVSPVLPLSSRTDASDDSFCAHTGRSLAAAAAAVKREAVPSPSRVVRSSASAEEAQRSSLAAGSCATTQRHLPVQHIQISRNADGVAEIALQFDLPLRRGSQDGREDSTADVLACAAERPLRALADSGGCGEASAPHGKGDDSSEGIRTARIAGEEVASAATQRKAERTERTAPGEGRGGLEGESRLRGAGSVSDEGPVAASASSIARRRPLLPLTEPALKSDACAVAAAASTDGRSATTPEEGGRREEEGLVSRRGDRVGRTSAEGNCPGTPAATAAPPVARLTLQQLKGVVSAAQLYCSTVGKHLQCFRENMKRVQRLSLLKAFRQVSEKSTSTEACTPSGDGNGLRSGEDKHSGSSGCADRGRSDTRSSRGGDVSSSSSSKAAFGSGREGSDSERADALGVVLAGTSDRGSPSVVDSASATRTPPSTVQQDKTTLLSVLQQLRLPRDQNLTAAEVLGVRAAEDSTTATAEDASECIAGSETASSRSDAAGTTPAEPAETIEVKQRKAEGPKGNGEKERELCSSGAAGEEEPKRAFPASAPDGRTSAVAAEAAEAEADLRHNTRHGKGSRPQQQQRLIVSLADVRDLSVLERSQEGAAATLRWQQHALRKRALWREKVEEAMNSVAAAAGGASGDRRAREVRGNSTESSVILLEHSEATGDADTWTEGKMEVDLSLRKKRKAVGDAAEDGAGQSGSAAADMSPLTTRGKGIGEAAVEGTPFRESAAAKPTDEEVGLIAGASELEALCDAVERESVKLLELVTFYENFSAECLRYAAQDRDYLDDENTRNG